MRLNYRDITLLLCCGAAGALSAVFKAPITGVVFVLEILMLDITVSSDHPAAHFDGHGHLADVFPQRLRACFQHRDQDLQPAQHPVLRRPGHAVRVHVVLLHTHQYGYRRRVCPPQDSGAQMARGRRGDRPADLYFPAPLRRRVRGDGRPDARQHRRAVRQFDVLLLPPHRVARGALPGRDALLQGGGDGRHDRRRRVGGTFAPSLFVGAFTGASAAFILDTYFGFDVPIVSFTLVGMAGGDVRRDEGSAHVDLPDRRTDQRLLAFRSADAHFGRFVRYQLLFRTLFDLYEKNSTRAASCSRTTKTVRCWSSST